LERLSQNSEKISRLYAIFNKLLSKMKEDIGGTNDGEAIAKMVFTAC